MPTTCEQKSRDKSREAAPKGKSERMTNPPTELSVRERRGKVVIYIDSVGADRVVPDPRMMEGRSVSTRDGRVVRKEKDGGSSEDRADEDERGRERAQELGKGEDQ